MEDAQKELETLGKDPTQELINNILATCIEYENKIEELTKLDHIKSFNEYIVNTLGANEIIQEELSEICK